jgi:hypothetical protein
MKDDLRSWMDLVNQGIRSDLHLGPAQNGKVEILGVAYNLTKDDQAEMKTPPPLEKSVEKSPQAEITPPPTEKSAEMSPQAEMKTPLPQSQPSTSSQ